jgi:hypothetical protein
MVMADDHIPSAAFREREARSLAGEPSRFLERHGQQISEKIESLGARAGS